MLNLAIIGCGQIGSRHLQSMALLEEEATIYLVDPSPESINKAAAQFRDVYCPESNAVIQLICTRSLEDLPDRLDLSIVATASDKRAAAVADIVEQVDLGYIILEKFLFQREEDYDLIGALLDREGISCFVNQWTSSLASFRRVASKLGEGPFHIGVDAAGWGLCCNAVHLLEFFDFLTGEEPCSLSLASSHVDSVIPAKRSGFFEILGRFKFATPGGSTISLACRQGQPASVIPLSIRSAAQSVNLEFGLDYLAARWMSGETETFRIPYQSKLTHRFVEALTSSGTCTLPHYRRSARQHLLLLQAFLPHFRAAGVSEGDICPIT
jgi:hypothetical protein